MKFYIFGDEERFLLDRVKELNRNFDKETRIKFLKSEVRKREQLLRKRWRNHRYFLFKGIIAFSEPFILLGTKEGRRKFTKWNKLMRRKCH